MKTKTQIFAERQAKRWAYDEHLPLMCKLPEPIREHIDWLGVASAIGIETEERPRSGVRAAIQKLIDYLYNDEAEDYAIMENHLKPGHIFEAVATVQRWLSVQRLK